MKLRSQINRIAKVVVAIIIVTTIVYGLHLSSTNHSQVLELQDQVQDLTTENEQLRLALRAASSPVSKLHPYLLTYTHDVGTLATAELSGDTCFYLTTQLPVKALKSERDGTHLMLKDNYVTAKVFYPQSVSAGETGHLVIIVNVNDSTESYTGRVAFTALEDLSLINGDRGANSYSGGGNLQLRNDGTIEIQFYTSATDDYVRPGTAGCYSRSNIFRCSYQAY